MEIGTKALGLALVAAVLVAGCGGDGDDEPAFPDTPCVQDAGEAVVAVEGNDAGGWRLLVFAEAEAQPVPVEFQFRGECDEVHAEDPNDPLAVGFQGGTSGLFVWGIAAESVSRVRLGDDETLEIRDVTLVEIDEVPGQRVFAESLPSEGMIGFTMVACDEDGQELDREVMGGRADVACGGAPSGS